MLRGTPIPGLKRERYAISDDSGEPWAAQAASMPARSSCLGMLLVMSCTRLHWAYQRAYECRFACVYDLVVGKDAARLADPARVQYVLL